MKPEQKRLVALFPDSVVVEEAAPELLVDDLYPEERAQIVRAVDKRKAEYATARVLARRAFARLGAPAAPVVNGEDRCPTWPTALVGSITHTRGYCAVVVARQGEVRSLGLDVERDSPAKAEIFDRICTPAELEAMAGLSDDERGRRIKALFSAKEAFYKAQYPITRQYLGFHAVDLELDLRVGVFVVRLNVAAGEIAAGSVFEGRIDVGGGLIRSALSL